MPSLPTANKRPKKPTSKKKSESSSPVVTLRRVDSIAFRESETDSQATWAKGLLSGFQEGVSGEPIAGVHGSQEGQSPGLLAQVLDCLVGALPLETRR